MCCTAAHHHSNDDNCLLCYNRCFKVMKKVSFDQILLNVTIWFAFLNESVLKLLTDFSQNICISGAKSAVMEIKRTELISVLLRIRGNWIHSNIPNSNYFKMKHLLHRSLSIITFRLTIDCHNKQTYKQDLLQKVRKERISSLQSVLFVKCYLCM